MLRLLFFVFLLTGYKAIRAQPAGSIERLDSAINTIIDRDATVEILAKGFEWSEGPLWLEKEKKLLFSDVPTNIVYQWTAQKGKEVYLKPSGYTGKEKRGGEIGSNGITLNNKGQLVLCQHGNRQVAVMNAPLSTPKPSFTAVARQYNGKKFNSPNDLIYDKKGNLYFTDPPYGLEQNMEDKRKEIPFQGVYRVSTSGKVQLLVDSITRPNGIALTPDEKQIIIANSDPEKPVWYLYDVEKNGSLLNGKIFYDAASALKQEQGLPDGLKIDRHGNIFASGPGGIWVFSNEGTVLGKIKFPELVSNCAFSADEKTLYITADDYLLRVKLRK